MEYDGPITLLLRFRDINVEYGEVIKTHAAICRETGKVWWGWWRKRGEKVPINVFSGLMRQIKTDGEIDIFLFDSGLHKLFKVHCNNIQWSPAGERITPPEPDSTPPDSRAEKNLAWFCFTEMDDVELDEAIIKQFSYLNVDEFFESGTSSFTNFYGKRVYSYTELRQMDRTIWFLRPSVSEDPSHEIVLLESAVTAPFHFSKTFQQSDSTSILWLSDIHFSNDGFHGFPLVSDDTSESLVDSLSRELESDGVKEIAGVFASGDLTWKADHEEFYRSILFFKEATKRFGLSHYQIATCPGNHDIAFSDNPAEKGQPVTRANEEARAGYEKFYQDFYYLKPNDYLSMGRKYLLAGCFPVEIVCLNSSLMDQAKEKFQGHGFIGRNQLRDASLAMGWKEKRESGIKAFRILMLHHHLVPVTYRDQAIMGDQISVVYDAGALGSWIVENKIDLVLHGHMHQPFRTRISKPVDGEDTWHDFYVCGLGSSGVNREYLGAEGHNTYGVIEFTGQGVEVTVNAFTPTEPLGERKRVWNLLIPYRKGTFHWE
jgi:3',5'-cyclic AMP phosphodiesterase CpdA